VHIHGEKFFTILDIPTAPVVSDDEIERSMTKHRNLKYDESFAPRGREFHLLAGDGCYVPYQCRIGCGPRIRSRSRCDHLKTRGSAASTTCTSSINAA